MRISRCEYARSVQLIQCIHCDIFTQKLLEEANELKQEGNDHFRLQSWNDALAVYRSALGRLPKRKPKMSPPNKDEDESGKGKGKERDTGDSDQEDEEEAEAESSKSQDVALESEPELTELGRECAKARAVLNSNIGACYVKLVSLPVVECVFRLGLITIRRETIRKRWPLVQRVSSCPFPCTIAILKGIYSIAR